MQKDAEKGEQLMVLISYDGIKFEEGVEVEDWGNAEGKGDDCDTCVSCRLRRREERAKV